MCGCSMDDRRVCAWHSGRIKALARDSRQYAEAQFGKWQCEVVLGPAKPVQ
jgi:hypothetical protein